MYTSNSSSNWLPVQNTMTTTIKTKTPTLTPTTATAMNNNNNNNEKHNNKGNSRRKGIFLLGIIVGIVITETHRNLSSMNIIDICGSARNALPSSGSLITVDDDRDQDGSSSSSSSNRVDTNNNKEIIKKKKQKQKQKRKQKLQQKLPLKPPFYIIQYGPSRTASTFQSQLLSIIVGLKSKQSITMDQKLQHTFAMSSIAGRKRDKKYGFVLKTHNQGQVYKTIDAFQQNFGISVSVFMSSNEISMNENESMISNSTTKINVLHDQTFANMSNCSLCEINNYYKPIFDLSNDDVTLLEEYMKNWEILRQCCGIQQSKYNRYRLHGCNMTQLYKEKPTNNYPYCENYNLPDIENNIVSMSKDIVYRHPNDNDNNGKLWSKPGDCKRIDQIIINGGEMNKVYKFKTCDTYFDQKQFQKYN